jgi:cyclomaltodextrinase / maltogenic alpha-amylase / neopullulanase
MRAICNRDIPRRGLAKMRLHHTSAFRLAAILTLAASISSNAALQEARDPAKQPARPAREWVRDGVVYEIFPRQFSTQGNFNGIADQLDRLKKLGVTVLWLMPIHPIGQKLKKGSIGSPYAVRDFYAINPDYGTKEDFRRLVSETHRRGMKLIIDIVANHTAWDSVMIATPEFYTRDAAGKILPIGDCCPDVADLNYDNPRLRHYMIEMLKYWVKEFDVDGFRCDIAYMVPTDFWESARKEVEAVKPDIFFLAESQEPDHLLKAFDANYDWPLFHAITDVINGNKPAAALGSVWESERARLPRGALRLRFSDNHDELRATARLGQRAALAASMLTFTLDGVPLLYNGMEVGDTTESSDPALFEKVPILWQINKRQREIERFYHAIIAFRRESAALRQGTVEWLRSSDDARVATYLRSAGTDEFLVAINFSNRPFIGLVGARSGSEFLEVFSSEALASEQRVKPRPSALPSLALEPWGFRLFRRARR